MIRGKWKWLLILLAALAVLVGLMALETCWAASASAAEPGGPICRGGISWPEA